MEERVEHKEEEVHLGSMPSENKPIEPENKPSLNFHHEDRSETGDEFSKVKETPPRPPSTLQEKIAEAMKERQIEKEISQKDITKSISEQPEHLDTFGDDQLHINLSDKPKPKFKKKKIKRVVRNKQRSDSNKDIPSISNRSSGRVPEIVEEELQSPNINQVKVDITEPKNDFEQSVPVSTEEKTETVTGKLLRGG